jgi:hypothetical protein
MSIDHTKDDGCKCVVTESEWKIEAVVFVLRLLWITIYVSPYFLCDCAGLSAVHVQQKV